MPDPASLLYDVIVVGLGPVGAVAAHLLAREGLSVLALDPMPVPYDKPRAIGLDHESLRILQKTGVAGALEPHLGVYAHSEYRSANGELLRRIIPQPEPHPLGWPPYSTFVQPELEKLLRQGFSHRKNLDIQLEWRLTDIEQDADEVRIRIEDSSGEDSRHVRARYLVGCDGAWSPVREAMGLALEDLVFDEPWLVVDMLVNDSARLPENIVQYCDPARPATFIRGPKNLCRWEIMLLPGEVPAEMAQEASIWQLLSRWLTPEQGEIWRAATYRFHALVGKQWQKGRVFIAGDAAHQTPPFMAQGLNQGLRDAGNLCWKLAQVIRHGASSRLLESYDEERRPNARAVIEMTKTLGRLICERDPTAAAERDRKMLSDMKAGRGEIVRQDLLPPLASGLLLGEGPGVGKMFPQPWIEMADGSRARMDEVLQNRFLLFVQGDWQPAAETAALARQLDIGSVRVGAGRSDGDVLALPDKDQLVGEWMKRHEAAAALVRPDHVVFGTASGTEDAGDLVTALDRALKGD